MALEDVSLHGCVALRPDIATVVVFPAKARRDDQLVHQKHMACDALLNFAAMLTVCMPLKVPTALLGGHYRHRFDLGRCFEAWVPSTCSINVPHGLRDPCWKWSELHRGERLGSSSRSIRAIGTPCGSGGGLEEAFSDFLGHHADLLEEHRRRSDLVPFFLEGAGG